MEVKDKMLNRKACFLLLLMVMFSFVLALPDDSGTAIDFTYPQTVDTNYSLLNVNNSQYFQGYTPLTLKDYFQGFYDLVYQPIGNYITGNIFNQNLNTTDSPTFAGLTTGTITSTATDTMLSQPTAGNSLVKIWDIHSGTNNYGFYRQYNGAGSGDLNSLQLWTDGQAGTDILSQSTFQSGNHRFEDNIKLGFGSLTSGLGNFNMWYDEAGATKDLIIQHTSDTGSVRVQGGSSAIPSLLIQAVHSGRPNMAFKVTGLDGGVAFNIMKGIVENTGLYSSNFGVVGLYGSGSSGTSAPVPYYMYFDSRTDGAYNKATLKIDSNDRVGIGISGSTRPSDTLDVGGSLTVNGATGDLSTVGTITGGSLSAGDGFTGSCVNVTYSGGIAISCND